MLEDKAQEASAIPLVQEIEAPSPDDDAAPQTAFHRRGLPAPSDPSTVETLHAIGALGLHDFIAKQFSNPEGICGRMAGAVMSLINHLPNKRAIELLDIAEQDVVLEMGFGPGRALKKMAALACKGTIIGVDRSPTMFRQAQARNRAAIEGGKLKLIQGRFEQLPLGSATVDKVLAVNVIYFCSPTGTALAEARRVLRRGGAMVIYATDCSSMRRVQFIGPETQQTFDRTGLEDFLNESAFGSDQIDIHTVGLPFGFSGLVARLRKLST